MQFRFFSLWWTPSTGVDKSTSPPSRYPKVLITTAMEDQGVDRSRPARTSRGGSTRHKAQGSVVPALCGYSERVGRAKFSRHRRDNTSSCDGKSGRSAQRHRTKDIAPVRESEHSYSCPQPQPRLYFLSRSPLSLFLSLIIEIRI